MGNMANMGGYGTAALFVGPNQTNRQITYTFHTAYTVVFPSPSRVRRGGQEAGGWLAYSTTQNGPLRDG